MRLSTSPLPSSPSAPRSPSAIAQTPVRAGILQCQGGQNVGFVVGSVTSFECVFQSEGRRPNPIIATVRRYGLDLGFTGQTRLGLGSQRAERPGWPRRIAGNYGGVGANASVGVGFGGNFLVGGPQIPTRCSRSACRARPA